MNALIFLALLSVGLTLILTPVVREIFAAYGVVDEPDQDRKIHKHPIARGGGIAVAVSYAVSFFIVRWWFGIADDRLALVWKILPAAWVVFIVGIVDDLWGLKAWQKLAGQVAAAGIACWSGILAVDGAGHHAHAWWTLPLAILWLLACSNGFNLIDGMDGLAAGAGLVGTLAVFAAALLTNNTALAMAALPLAGCLLGFLCYNFNPASVFLGDSGSLLIGFVLGCFGIVWAQKSASPMGVTAPLMALSLPLIDVALAITRRFLGGQPIFSADRAHVHHRLLDHGWSPKAVALMLYSVCIVAAGFSLLESVVIGSVISGFILLAFFAVAAIGVRCLGYAEFSSGDAAPRPTALAMSVAELRRAADVSGFPK